MKKKIIAFMSLSLLVLAGCSNNDDADKDVGGSKEDIVVWAMGDEAKEIEKMTTKFEEQTDYKVNVQAIPWDTAHEKLLTAVASKSGPDVIQMGTTWMPEFQEAGALTNLDEYIEEHDVLNPNNFFEGSVETTMFDDSYFGIPWVTETRVLFYRTDLLAEVGYDEAPKTWEELEDAAAKLADRGENMYGFDIDTNEQSLAFMYARQNGSELFTEDNTPLFNEPEFVEAVTAMDNFIQKGYAPKGNLELELAQTFGEDGMVPMFVSGPWMVKIIKDTIPEIDGDWSIAQLPKKENNLSSLGGSNFVLFEHSENKDGGIEFMKFMSEKDTQLEWLEITEGLPTVKAAWEEGILLEDEFYTVFGDQLENARPMPLITEFEQIAQKFLERFENIYLGGSDIQTEMDEFVEETTKLVE